MVAMVVLVAVMVVACPQMGGAAGDAAHGEPGLEPITISSADGSLALRLQQASGLAALRLQSVSVNGTSTALSNRSGLTLGFGGRTFPVSDGSSSATRLAGGGISHWRDCHFAGVPSTSLLKQLLPGEGGAAD